MKISQDGINLIKQFEGCRLSVYLDAIGVPTVGYGHTSGLTKSMVGKTITQAQADEYLRTDLQRFENYVNAAKLELNQHQFDALVSFTYNCGPGNLKKLIADKNTTEIGNALVLYNKAGGKVLNGLVRRREAEKQMYFFGGENKSACPFAEPTKILKKGDNGNGVRWVQWYLNKKGSTLAVDGDFGDKTDKAVRKFQKKKKLVIDGEVGEKTRKKLKK